MPPAVTPSDEPTSTGATTHPVALRVVLAGVAFEALVLGAAAGAVLVELVEGGSRSVGVSVFLVLFFLGLAAGLVAASRALWAGRRGGRAPIAVWQVMQGLVGITLLTAGARWAVLSGVALLAVAGVVLVLLLTRGVVDVTAR